MFPCLLILKEPLTVTGSCYRDLVILFSVQKNVYIWYIYIYGKGISLFNHVWNHFRDLRSSQKLTSSMTRSPGTSKHFQGNSSTSGSNQTEPQVGEIFILEQLRCSLSPEVSMGQETWSENKVNRARPHQSQRTTVGFCLWLCWTVLYLLFFNILAELRREKSSPSVYNRKIGKGHRSQSIEWGTIIYLGHV